MEAKTAFEILRDEMERAAVARQEIRDRVPARRVHQDVFDQGVGRDGGEQGG